jgi:hypothetical protein
MIEAHKVYLTAELQKFHSTSWSSKFLGEIPPDALRFLSQVGLPIKPEEFSSSLGSHSSISVFLRERSSSEIERLSQILSTFRNNGVHGKITAHQVWKTVRNVPLANVYVYPAEPSLKDLFRRNSWKLLSIVGDHDLWISKPYNQWSREREVEYRICLADNLGNENFKVFDGVHRAIQLAWRAETGIDICCPN